jgi:hypothetical protein
MAFANTGVKMEKCALGVSNVGLKIDSGLFRKSTAATEITTNEILIKTGAFASLAKAFMKIG